MTLARQNHPTQNHHCTCVEINSIGIMIEGPSGSGKTSLALGLLDAARLRLARSVFVCDDQAILRTQNNELWASVPKPLAGKVELRGFGIADIKFANECKIGLVCGLVNQEKIMRYPSRSAGHSECKRLGVILDYVQTPVQHEAQGIRILLQKLSLPL